MSDDVFRTSATMTLDLKANYLDGGFYLQTTLTKIKEKLLWQQITCLIISYIANLSHNFDINKKGVLSFSETILKDLFFKKHYKVISHLKYLKLF